MNTDATKAMDDVVLAELDLAGCPVGNALDAREPDQGINDRYFAGWKNLLTPHPYWNRQSEYQVVLDDGEEVLEHAGRERCLITGDLLWGDYAVEATVRQMDHKCVPNHDDEYCTVGRTGIVLRQQDVRRYYIFCIESFSRAVLYRREDTLYYPLGLHTDVFCSHRYYTLRAEVQGDRLRCFVDGRPVIEAEDGTFSAGKAGVRTNTTSRVKGVRITAAEAGRSAYLSAMEKYEKALAELREGYPKPVLWKKLAPDFGGEFTCRFGDLQGTGGKDVLVFKGARDAEFGRLTRLRGIAAMDLDGEVLWTRDDIVGAMHYKSQTVADIDGDGADEVICSVASGSSATHALGNRILVLDGRTGETRMEAGTIYEGNQLLNTQALYFCNLQGREKGLDVVAMASGHTIWAYDDNLRLLWRHTMDAPMYGHNISFCDLDGDGRDEVAVGYWMLDAEGKLLWRVEHGDDIPNVDHSDSCIAGEFDGNEANGPEVAVVGGDFYLMSARDGRVRVRAQVGHTQGLSVGNFRPDLPGLEILCGTRWDNYGILAVFSGSGELLARFHPDNVSQGGAAINWTGDGGELIFMKSSREALGMFDGYGRKVVVFPEDGEFPAGDYYSFWDGQAMNVDVVGDARDEVVIVKDGVLYIYTQDTPFPKGERIYVPVRKHGQQVGNPISTPGWKVNEA